jgi:hypothetical protein
MLLMLQTETRPMKVTKIIAAALPLLIGGGVVASAQTRGQQPPSQQQGKKDDQGRGAKPVPPQEQQQRVKQEQVRATQYKQKLDNQVRVAQQKATDFQNQKRTAQAQAQQQYAAQLRQQQQQIQTNRDYSKDPYVQTPHTFKYVVSGKSRQTNQYGADVLRQAVNNGYTQGFRAGAADHQDHRRSSYQTSFGYTDANYGYGGNYVDQSDYNYYFRQGFRRGYDDGYNSRSRYGSSSNGTPTILGSLLTSILGLASIR